MLLEVRDMVVQYGRIRALHGISLVVQEGELVTLLGSNGAGKTTTMRAISGLLPLTSGSVWFDGADISEVKAHHRVSRGPGAGAGGPRRVSRDDGRREPRNGLLRAEIRVQGRARRAARLGAGDVPAAGRAP